MARVVTGFRDWKGHGRPFNALIKMFLWLAKRADVKAAGEPYAIYWNSPSVPFFLKKSEVHLPVVPTK